MIKLFMNTWANYNESGADGTITPTGWMSPDEALKYWDKYAEYEPFVNDVDSDYDLGLNEYSFRYDIESIDRFNDLSEYEKKFVAAILEADSSYTIDDAVDIAQRGYYLFFDVDNDEDLAREYIAELGGIENALSPETISEYIDYENMKETYRSDVEYNLYDDARYELGEDATEEEIDDWVDDNIDDYLESIVDEDIYLASRGEIDLSDFFDYEKFGEELAYDYDVTSYGYIQFR